MINVSFNDLPQPVHARFLEVARLVPCDNRLLFFNRTTSIGVVLTLIVGAIAALPTLAGVRGRTQDLHEQVVHPCAASVSVRGHVLSWGKTPNQS